MSSLTLFKTKNARDFPQGQVLTHVLNHLSQTHGEHSPSSPPLMVVAVAIFALFTLDTLTLSLVPQKIAI